MGKHTHINFLKCEKVNHITMSENILTLKIYYKRKIFKKKNEVIGG